MPRMPSYTAINQKGTMSEKKGNCRPTMVLNVKASMPVTPWSAMMGVPIAPKATGAVFAMSESPDA